MAFDRTDPADLLALKTEVNTDPAALGYDVTQTNTGIVDVINLPRATITIQKENISAAKVRAATTYDAYDTLSIDEQEWIRWITGSNGVSEESLEVTTDLRQQLAGDPTANSSIWAAAHRTVMNAAMLAIMDRDGSRAEELFGIATNISRDDWIAARDS